MQQHLAHTQDDEDGKEQRERERGGERKKEKHVNWFHGSHFFHVKQSIDRHQRREQTIHVQSQSLLPQQFHASGNVVVQM